MSIVAMVAAALGFLPVVAGAILQEAIDVVVILNALRALRGGVEAPIRVPGWTETSARLRAEHLELEPSDRPDPRHGRWPRRHVGRGRPRRALEEIRRFVSDDLLPHEELEDRTIYPMLAAAMGSDDATASMHRTHQEIFGSRGCSIASSTTCPPTARAAMTGPTSSASSTASKRSCACTRPRRRTCT